MNKVLWAVQVILAVAFAVSGVVKLMLPAEELMAAGMQWVETTGIVVAKLAGTAEILAAVGLIVPAATKIMPKLTGYAALGLVAVMVGAVATHVIRAEYMYLPVNAVLLALSAFVAWGRLHAEPIPAKQEAFA